MKLCESASTYLKIFCEHASWTLPLEVFDTVQCSRLSAQESERLVHGTDQSDQLQTTDSTR